MFSSGQIAFTIVFIILFTIAVAIAYKKDKKLHLKNYKGVRWVAMAFLLFIIILFTIKILLKN